MGTEQVEFTAEELLATDDVVEPLVAGGVRCHGGFTADGSYVSPRTKFRTPAIAAWQAQHAEQFGTTLLDLPLDTWPARFPSVEQARFLIGLGAREPIISELTRVGTVEGFGAFIRHSVVPDLERTFVEDTRGTAMAHLTQGLYEAHARDEAGYEDEGGHRQMWFAARDVAFEHPVTEDETVTMLERMGIARPGSGGAVDPAKLRADALAHRVLPDDIDFDLESLITRMARLLLIEISAFHIFAWAEELLSDTELVAGDGEAARLVSYIRADETPHVQYLRTVLSEMRDRTVVGLSGRRYAGADVVGPIWDKAVANSLGAGRRAALELMWQEIDHALADGPDPAGRMAELDAMGTAHRSPDGTWTEDERPAA